MSGVHRQIIVWGRRCVVARSFFKIVWQFVFKIQLKACNTSLSLLRYILWPEVNLLCCGSAEKLLSKSHFKLCPRSAVKLLIGSAAVLALGHFFIVCWQFVVKVLLEACNNYLSLLRFILWSGVRLLFCGCFRWIRLMILAGLCSCRKASTSGSRHIPTCLEAQSPLSITWPV